MTTLLIIIYVSFISLGLPDSVLGSIWPQMQIDLHAGVSLAGYISMTITTGTVISSILSDRMVRRFGVGKVTAVSVLMTAAALLGFALSPNVLFLFLFAIPLGLGAGSVDVALNNFVALHYEAKHMSWLHCFWGVGATAGPYIMGFVLMRGMSWNTGYRTISIMQMVLTAVLIFTLPLWREKSDRAETEEEKQKPLSLPEVIRLPGAKNVLVGFFCYCSLEATAGLWASSYMVLNRGISAETAAKCASLFILNNTRSMNP